MIIDAAELKRRHLLRIAGARDNKIYIGPQVVTLDVTNVCNLRCKYCHTGHAPGNPAHFDKAYFFSWEKFVAVVHDAVDLNVDCIQIAGLGEPSRHPLFRDMMAHLEQQPIYVRLFSNGTFPSDYCLDAGKCDRVTINLGAVDGQHQQDVQGKDHFDHVVANIKRLVSLRDAGKPGLYIDLCYVINRVNFPQKQKMQDLASQLNVNEIEFKKMEGYPDNRTVALPPQLGGEIKRTPPVCLNGWFDLAVRPNGHFNFCHRLPPMPPDDLEKWSLKQFWLSLPIMEMRCAGKYGHVQKVTKGCQTCPFYYDNMQRALSLGQIKNEQATADT